MNDLKPMLEDAKKSIDRTALPPCTLKPDSDSVQNFDDVFKRFYETEHKLYKEMKRVNADEYYDGMSSVHLYLKDIVYFYVLI